MPSKEYDRIILVYNQFKNAAVQRLVAEQYLPIVPDTIAGSKETKTSEIADYIFEPDKETIIRELIPKSLRIQLYKALLDSFASEQGARMTAMQQATDNAKGADQGASDLLQQGPPERDHQGTPRDRFRR